MAEALIILLVRPNRSLNQPPMAPTRCRMMASLMWWRLMRRGALARMAWAARRSCVFSCRES